MNDYGSGDTLRNLPAITLASADHTRFTREMHRQGYSSERVFARVLILEALAERAKKQTAMRQHDSLNPGNLD
ncbi:MAG: hypothetical protein PUK79_14375 [Clostridiales bacterium]|nr:hypothetical protein [Clostridiales bacterium]